MVGMGFAPSATRKREERDGEYGREPAASQAESLASCHRSNPKVWITSIPPIPRVKARKSVVARNPSPRCRCDSVSTLSLRPDAGSDFT